METKITTKRCPICGQILTLDHFYLNSEGGYYSYCKKCTKERKKDYYQKTKQKQIDFSQKSPLSQFTPRQLINELIDRGYRGKLYYTQEINLVK